MKTKHKIWFYAILLTTIGIVSSQKIIAQNLFFPVTPDAIMDTVFDQFGNKYGLRDIVVDTTTRPSPYGKTTQLCTSGYFDLYFETGSGMEGAGSPDANRRAVICQVFSDLSAFIGSPLNFTGQKVKIWVRNINNIPGGSSALGMATAFYSVPYNSSSSVGGIVDNEVWKTIHTGVDSYSNTVSPITQFGGSTSTFFHGMMAFNFNAGINWNTVLTTPTITSTYYDLYSVALHEITHALGFSTLINYNGTSKFGAGYNYYARYDLFLKKGSTNLITNTGACNSMYNYQFNSSLSSTVITPGCTVAPTPTFSGVSDLTTCSVSITYSSSNTNVPVYTPSCFEPPSSLSHFEDICQVGPGFTTTCSSSPANNNLYYVMSNVNGSGNCFLKRYLKPEERLVLCDLGYSVTTTYGNSGNYNNYTYTGSTCSGITVSGVNDGITSTGNYSFVTTASSTISITGILGNDVGASTFECLQDLTAPGAYLSVTSGNSSTAITFSSTVTGVHLLRYVPVSSGGERGNITYVYVYVGIGACSATSCNLVSNGDFETLTTSGVYPNNEGQITKSCGWNNASTGTPDYFHSSSPYPVDVPCNIEGYEPDKKGLNAYMGVAYRKNATQGDAGESVYSKLSTALLPNTSYILTFDASLGEALCAVSFPVQVYFQNGFVPSASQFVPISNPSMLFTTTAINSYTGWSTRTVTFTTGPTAGEDYIVLGSVTNSPVPSTLTPAGANLNGCAYDYSTYHADPSIGQTFCYIDNIVLQPLSYVTHSLNLPPSICSSQTISDLSAYVTPTAVAGGTFTGTGVSLSGGVYSFNAATAGLGTFTITYTYTNNIGCTVSVMDDITVTSSVSASASSATICPSQSTTLTASGSLTYTWNPGSLTGSSVVVTPSVTTVYSVTGCSSTKTIAITVTPNPALSVSASPTIVCLSTSTLTASGATTYSWNTGPTTSTIAVTPTVTTIYTVTGTASGCSSTTTLSVTYGATAPIVSVSSNTPVGCGGSTTLTASGGASYTWSPGGATTSTIAVTTSVVTVYTVTSTFGGSCGTGTTAVVINPNTSTLCCSSSNTTMGTSLTSTVSIAGTYSGTVIDVKGTLLSAGSVTFTGCTLRMSKGARIVMSPDHDLTLTNCKLFSCSELWDGIYFQTFLGKIGNITVSSSSIEDMYNGIVMDYAGYNVPSTPVCGNVTIDQSILNKNYISIQMKNSSGVTAASAYGLALTSSTISSNTSTSSPGSTLKPSSTYTYAYNTWTGGATSSTNTPFVNFPRSYVGIYLYDLRDQDPVIVGDSTNSAKTNTFDNMDFGIVDVESVVKVHNNYFKNITGSLKQTADGETWPAAGPDEIGIAVFAKHPVNPATYTLTVGTHTALPSSNSQYPKGNQFEDCNKCVSATSCKNVFVKGNVITAASTNTVPVYGVDAYYYYKGQNGIWVSDLYDRETLDYNSISNISTGIYSSHTLGSSTPSLSISYNDIAAPSSNGFCKQAIQAAQTGGTNMTTGNFRIENNTITNVYNGILVSSVPNSIMVRGNDVNIEDVAKTLGSTATTTRTAVRVNSSTYAQVLGNTIHSNCSVTPTTSTAAGYLTGIYVSGSTNAKVECNSTYHIGRDFVFQAACGSSSWKVNTMYDSYRGLELYLAGVIGQQGGTGSPNLSANTWTTITQETYMNASNPNTNSRLYLAAGGTPKTEPTLNFGTNAYSTAFGGLNIATGTSYTCSVNGAQRLANGNGKNSGSTGGGNAMRTAGAETDSLDEYKNLATAGEESYEVFPEEMIFQNRQFVYRMIEQDSINPAVGSTLESFYTNNQNTAIGKLTAAEAAIANFDITAATTANNSAPVSNTVEQYYQRANELTLKYMNDRNYQFSTAETQELYSMASDCPAKGAYVARSRNLIDLITRNNALYDDNCDTQINNRKAKIVGISSQASFNLFPNPNNGSMQLDYDLGNNNSATMNLFDVTGKLVKSYKLENTKGTLQINEQTLHNGVYFYHILVNGKSIKNDKIVVIK